LVNDGLNRALREFNLTQPSHIMDKLNEFVDETFERSEEEIKDGMDMALCMLNLADSVLEYAGANNPLYVIRPKENGVLMDNGYVIEVTVDSPSHNLFEIRPDKQPIGRFSERHNFTNHRIPILKGDTFYTFSDGYADQFGGPKGKKFKYKPFKELLLGIQHKTMLEQRSIIHQAFESWKNPEDNSEAFEQIDDVVVIGVRV
jgi:serine phosphatase RsbU (regulator of sigma subunit)